LPGANSFNQSLESAHLSVGFFVGAMVSCFGSGHNRGLDPRAFHQNRQNGGFSKDFSLFCDQPPN